MRALAHRHDLVLSVDDFGRSFERHLHAARKSPRTVKTYMEAVQLLSAFLEQQAAARRRWRREGKGVAAQVLVRLGADHARVREQVRELLPGGDGGPKRQQRGPGWSV